MTDQLGRFFPTRLLVLSALVAAAVAVARVASATPSTASHDLLVGLYDQGVTLYDNPATTFPVLSSLHVKVLRLNLDWGGPVAVARMHPVGASNPNDTAYDWGPYDRAVELASRYGIQVLFVIVGTPGWENGGAGWNRAPRSPVDLRSFALAAATRFSGSWLTSDGVRLPAVRLWAAWNEPNNPVFLTPQFRRVGSTWVVQSAVDYARICTAVYAGVHTAGVPGDEVACGLTAPRGNNAPAGPRPSVAPLTFVDAVHAAGLKHFDAWAHHPYPIRPSETPTTKPDSATAVTLGDIGTLIDAVTRYWGAKPIWITEYGYQTNPPDRIFGVTWSKQAGYLTQSFAIARSNPRIRLMLWFLLKDEPNLSGWQSGLETVIGRHKRSFAAFQHLPR